MDFFYYFDTIKMAFIVGGAFFIDMTFPIILFSS